MPHLKELGEEENFINKSQMLSDVFYRQKNQSSILRFVKKH